MVLHALGTAKFGFQGPATIPEAGAKGRKRVVRGPKVSGFVEMRHVELFSFWRKYWVIIENGAIESARI